MSPTQRRSDSPRLDTTANNNKAALPGNVKQPVLKEFIMNTKQLFAAAAFAVHAWPRVKPWVESG